MSLEAKLALLIPLGYVLGSIPFGLIVGRLKGVDVRQSGSGNIGATNVARVLGGKRWFFLVFSLDLLKGLAPMLLAATFVLALLEGQRGAGVYLLWLLVGFAAVLGHMYSLFLRFTGGKGVATSVGVVLGLAPYLLLPGLAAVGVFVAVFLITRYVSLGSIVAACAFPVAYVGFALALGWDLAGRQFPLFVFSTLMAGLIVYKHRGNIARLRAGTEHRAGRTPPRRDAI